MRKFVIVLFLITGCGGNVAGEMPETFVQCEVHTRHLSHNINGCWRITSRQGFVDERGYVCASQPTCEVIPGDEQDYVSGDVAWVGDVKCDNECKQ